MVEPEAKVVDTPERGLRNGSAHVIGKTLRRGIGQNVAVRIDEAGEDCIGRQVNDGDASGCGVGDGLHAIAGDEDVCARADLACSNVNELAGKDRLGDGGRSRCLAIGVEEESNEAEGGDKNRARRRHQNRACAWHLRFKVPFATFQLNEEPVVREYAAPPAAGISELSAWPRRRRFSAGRRAMT